MIRTSLLKRSTPLVNYQMRCFMFNHIPIRSRHTNHSPKDHLHQHKKHHEFKRRFPEIGTKRLIVHNYKNPKAENPSTIQIDPS